MSGRLVVKRYVKALVMAAEESASLDSVSADIEAIAAILREKEIKDFCLKSISSDAAGKFVQTAFIPYVGEYTGRWLTVMAENGRLAALPFAEDAFRELMEQRNGIVSVVLETANEPGDQLVSSILGKIEKHLGKKVVLDARINKALLGGFRLIWQNRILDRSVKGRINNLKMALK